MGIFDKISEVASGNADQVKDAIEKVGDFVDEKTGDKFADKVDQAQEFAKEQLDKLARPAE